MGQNFTVHYFGIFYSLLFISFSNRFHSAQIRNYFHKKRLKIKWRDWVSSPDKLVECKNIIALPKFNDRITINIEIVIATIIAIPTAICDNIHRIIIINIVVNIIIIIATITNIITITTTTTTTTTTTVIVKEVIITVTFITIKLVMIWIMRMVIRKM